MLDSEPNPNKHFRNRSGKSVPERLLTQRFTEIGVRAARFIHIKEGTKESYTDHTDQSNQFGHDLVDGNFGVMAGDGLIIVDVDDWNKLPDVFKTLIEERPTLTISTPHSTGKEGHYLFISDSSIENIKREWGEIRATNQYVVGPGSKLTECKYGCCTSESPGCYEIACNRLIATINPDEIPDLKTNNATKEPVEPEPPINDHNIPIKKRVDVAKNSAHGEKFTALWEGRYRDAGFDNRSDAEASLVAYLSFYLQGNREAVREAMNLAVSKHPEGRKWNDPEAGEQYRDTTLELVDEVENQYTPPHSRLPNDPRPPTSDITRSKVYEALLDLEIASTAEIAKHEAFDRSQRQARRVMNEWQESDVPLVNAIRDGRQVLYYFEGLESIIPPEKREQYDL